MSHYPTLLDKSWGRYKVCFVYCGVHTQGQLTRSHHQNIVPVVFLLIPNQSYLETFLNCYKCHNIIFLSVVC